MKPGYVQTSIVILVVGFFVCFCAPGCMAQGELSRPTNPGAGAHSFTLTVGGLERTYIVHVPSSYNLQKQLSAVVIMFHGGGGTARAAMWETGWAEKAGFLAVFPNAMSRDPAQPSSFAGNPQLWNDGSGRFYSGRKAPDDVRFIHAMLDDLLARFAADPRRVFVTGFSNGASMSFRLGAELSKRIAAIAPVTGACWLEPLSLERPVRNSAVSFSRVGADQPQIISLTHRAVLPILRPQKKVIGAPGKVRRNRSVQLKFRAFQVQSNDILFQEVL
jgi:polyhydroxybutyrate depolymerase